MTDARFDELIHAPKRLQICGLAAVTELIEFAALRDTLGVSDSVLSKHLAALEDAGYAQLRKTMSGSRIRTWVTLTPAGRAAFDGHVAALHAIASGQPVRPPPRSAMPL